MKMSFIEKQELKLAICKNFDLMIETVEKMETLATEVEAGIKDEKACKLLGALLVKSLEILTKNLNELLANAYSLEDADFMAELKEATDKVIKGKEHLVILAVMLGDEN